MVNTMKNDIKQKTWFDVKIEVTMPGTLTYRVFAEDAEQAILLTKHMQPSGVKHKLTGVKKLKATVLDMGSTMIRLVKNMVGH